MRLDGHRARQSLIGRSVHCANSYILQHIHIYVLHMRDVGICTVYTNYTLQQKCIYGYSYIMLNLCKISGPRHPR